uniref:Uncharacterized protein n=1 Tax=Galaxaura rugosa TaxID=268570 RepID=A0A1G4NT03_9FLOR|nr:Hypothetical protein ORF_5 [Galaxaura rugosa]SCW21745.1 Hypothetical protein ORF_5 [Galaxaura rugosa]
MINLQIFNFFPKTIYYPKSWLTRIPLTNKIIFICLYLIILPFSSLEFIICYTFIILASFLILSKNLDIRFLQSTFLYCILFIVINSIDRSDYNTMYTVKYQFKTISLYFSNNSRISRLTMPRLVIYTYNNLVFIKFSNLSIRSFSLLINYFIIYQIIGLTTDLSELLLYNINFFSGSLPKSSFMQNIIFIIFLSYEFIFILETSLSNITLALILKESDNHYFGSNIVRLINLVYCKLIQSIQEEILKFIQIIYIREILIRKQDLWLV